MYEIFEQLLQKFGVSSYKVSKDTGIAQSIFSSWKTGKSTPKTDKLQLIADYFGVSVNYLLTGKKEAIVEAAIIPKDERDIGRKISELISLLSNRDDLLFEGKEIGVKTRELIKINLNSCMDLARLSNK